MPPSPRLLRPRRKLAAVEEVVLHVGAHRTGTTRLQSLLQANHAGIAAQGVFALTPSRGLDVCHADLGDVFTRLRIALGRPRSRRGRIAAPFLAKVEEFQALSTIDDLMPRPFSRLLISEENILGGLGGVLRGTLYADAFRRCANLNRLFGGRVRRVFFGVRPYDAFFESAYAMQAVIDAVPDFAVVRDRVLTMRRGWPEVVEDLRRAFPEADVVVWTHDRFDERMRLKDLLSGLSIEEFDFSKRSRNAAPSAEAVEALVARRRRGGCDRKEAEDIVRRIDAAGRSSPFVGFSEKDRSVLRARYEEDLRRCALAPPPVTAVSC